MKNIDKTMLVIAIDTMRSVKERTDALRNGDGTLSNYDGIRRGVISDLVDFGFTVKDDWNMTAISYGGVRSTCTFGVMGCIGNWLRAAEKALAVLS